MLAKKLKQQLDAVGKDARNIAEFGIGTNDSAKLSGVLLEDEKVMGTIHIALGNNVSMGGSVNVPIHLDGVVKKPTVWMDGKLLMKDGKLARFIISMDKVAAIIGLLIILLIFTSLSKRFRDIVIRFLKFIINLLP